MDKPQPKQEVKILSVGTKGHIQLYASTDAATDFAEFGSIYLSAGAAELYDLFVDGRYDLDEVVRYIENYGRE